MTEVFATLNTAQQRKNQQTKNKSETCSGYIVEKINSSKYTDSNCSNSNDSANDYEALLLKSDKIKKVT